MATRARTGLENPFDYGLIGGFDEFDLDQVESTGPDYLTRNVNELSKRFNTIDKAYPNDFLGTVERAQEAGSALYGQAGSMVGDVLGSLGSAALSTVGAVGDFLTPDAVTDPLVSGVKRMGNAVLNSEPVQQGVKIASDHYKALPPEVQRMGGDLVDISNMFGAASPIPGVNPALRGGGLTAASNLIPGKYGSTTLNVSMPEQKLIDGAVSLVEKSGAPLKATQKKALSDGLGRVMGFGKWASQSATNAVTYYFNPKARALYEEQGIGPLLKKEAIKLNIGDSKQVDESALKKLMAQGMYNRHIIKQSGKTGEVSPQMQAIGNFGVLAESTTAKPGVYREMVKPLDQARVPDADLNAFESHIRKTWGSAMDSDANIILKGSAQLSGNHSRDLWSSPVYKTLTKSFDDLIDDPKGKYKFESDADLRKHLEKYADSESVEGSLTASAMHMLKTKGRGDALKRKHFSIIPEDQMTPEMKASGGVWIKDGFAGTSYTEGGVNGIYKVDKDWNVTLVISDEHNYFESLTKPILPNSQMMVSMPFKKNIAMQKLLPKDSKERMGFVADNFGMMGGDASKGTAIDIIKGIKGAAPSSLGTARQASGLFNTYVRPQEEE
jgi:hypothetical protein